MAPLGTLKDFPLFARALIHHSQNKRSDHQLILQLQMAPPRRTESCRQCLHCSKPLTVSLTVNRNSERFNEQKVAQRPNLLVSVVFTKVKTKRTIL